MNSTSETPPPENMAQTKSWVFFLVIAVCVLITQAIAYFATPQKTLEDRKYILNILAFYTVRHLSDFWSSL